MKRRLLSLLLAGAMTAGMLSGCGSNSSSNGGEDKKTESASGKETKGEEAGETKDGEKELTTVKILAPIEAWTIQNGGYQLGETPACKVFYQDLEDIGLRLEVETIDYEQFANVVNTRMASGVDMPDMISYVWMDNGDQVVKEWADAGLVYELNALLDQYDEDDSIRNYYREKATGVLEKVSFNDGKDLYWFSYLYGTRDKIDPETGKQWTGQGFRDLSIRQDWVEALGEEIQLSYTMDELVPLLKRMYDEDVNGNGKHDEVINVNIAGFDNGFAKYYGLTNQLLCGFYEGDYEVFSNFYHENFPAYIELMNSLYEYGLYDTEALTSGVDKMISEDRVSATYGYTGMEYENYFVEKDDSKVYYVPVLLDADGDLSNGLYRIGDNITATAYCNYFIPTSNKNPEAVIRLMDYVYTDKFSILEEYGIMGKGVIEDENGNLVNVVAETEEQKSLNNYNITPWILPCIYTVPCVGKRYNEGISASLTAKLDVNYYVIDNLWETIEKNHQMEFVNPSLATPTEEEHAFISEKYEVLSTYASELLTDLVLGNKSIDDLPEYQKELEKLGLKEYMEIMAAQSERVRVK